MALYQRVMWLSGRAQMALSLRADGSGLPRFAQTKSPHPLEAVGLSFGAD